ncbi:MAG: hypothetical protein AVDCRST_MAG26-985, partial [uncultured Chloroflexia bacterium]
VPECSIRPLIVHDPHAPDYLSRSGDDGNMLGLGPRASRQSSGTPQCGHVGHVL